LTYSSDSWDQYFIAAVKAEGETLKPYLTNLFLRVKTYNVEQSSAALELERKFNKVGINYAYNAIRTDRFLMTKGNKTYKTSIVNGGDPFLFAFVSLCYSDAVEGNVTLNPFEALVKHVDGPGDENCALAHITAWQGDRELNRFYPKHQATDHQPTLADYMRTAELAKVNCPLQRSYYDTTFEEFEYGYGHQLFSCALVQADVASPAGRLSTGETEFRFSYTAETKRNLVAKLTYIVPQNLILHKDESDAKYKLATAQQF